MHRPAAVLAYFLLLACCSAAADPAALKAAVDLYQQRKPLEAQKAFEALARADAQNADVLFYLGRLALQRDDPDAAITLLEKAVALVPTDSRYFHRLGDAYGRAGKSRTAYEKAVELDPKSVDARLSLLGFYQQAPGIVGGGMDKAYAQAQEIKKLDANRGRMAVAGLYVTEKKFDLAFAQFEEALKSNPDDYAALFQFGRLAAISGLRMDEGLVALRKCLTQTPPEGQPPLAAAHWRIGFILEKQGDKAGARAEYEASLKLDPKFPQALESLRKL